MNRPKVLVADDDFDIRELLRFLLELEGYEVLSAGNGFEALGAAVAHRPDLVVLDVVMPGENGYLVSRAIRQYISRGEEWAPHIPIVLLTARDLRDDPERERAFLDFSGADEVVYKPFDSARVTSIVKALLGGSEQPSGTGSPPLKLTEIEPGRLNGKSVSSILQVAGAEWNPGEMWLS